jgi:hypothetical protein
MGRMLMHLVQMQGRSKLVSRLKLVDGDLTAVLWFVHIRIPTRFAGIVLVPTGVLRLELGRLATYSE